MITIGDLMLHARDVEARDAGISAADIAVARKAGMLPADVARLRSATQAEPPLSIVVRCPKASAYAWQGLLPAKMAAISKKTGDAGVVSISKLRRDEGGTPLFRDGEPIVDSALFVSDYDLMGVWELWRDGWRRVRITAAGGAKQGSYGNEASELLRRLNRSLRTKIQHGCQDDWHSADNRGVRQDDGFAGFNGGRAVFLDGSAACAKYYVSNGLGNFPYDAKSGAYLGLAR